jgi:hypothetical protein
MYETLKRIDPGQIQLEVWDYFRGCTRAPGHKGPSVPVIDGKAAATSKVNYIVAPQEWVLVQFFGKYCGFDAAWDMPFTQARCMYDAYRNSTGEDTSLESRADEARIDDFLARQAAENKEPR